MESVKEKIVDSLSSTIDALYGEKGEVALEIPEDSINGDYSSSIALKLSKKIGKSPREIAEEIKSKLPTIDCVEKVEIAGPGFLNFYLSKDYLISNLNTIFQENDAYGTSQANAGKKAVVEFSSPNIAKPFTVGHLRSTIIGNALANLLTATGWTVYRDNHLGDWGTQFGKQIYAIKTWGNEEEIEKSENPVKELVALYVKFHEEAEKDPSLEDDARAWFKKLEEGDSEARRLWQKCIDWSFKEFDKLYKMLNVSFTENNGKGYGESYFEDKMQLVIDELQEKGVLREDKGAQLVYFPDDKYPPLMIIKQDGATLYATRDLATDKFRLETYGKDIVILNEVGGEQALYFNQLYETEKMLGWVRDGQRIHVKHGLYRFKDQKMSTRKGNTIWLEDVLKEAIQKAESLGKEGESENVAKEVGISSLKWNDLKRNPVQDIVFDWDDILNMEGNSGPYVQYGFARTQSILRKAEMKMTNVQSTHKLENEEVYLLRMLAYFPEIVLEASDRLSTAVLCNYLFELTQKFSLFYEKHRILNAENEETKEFRLGLTAGVGQVLKNGLHLLGISAPVKI